MLDQLARCRPRQRLADFVDEWSEAFAAASDWVCLTLTVIYALMAQAHIGAGSAPDLATISRQACGALNAYLESLRKA